MLYLIYLMCQNDIELWFCMQVYFLANRSYGLLAVFLVTGQSQEMA